MGNNEREHRLRASFSAMKIDGVSLGAIPSGEIAMRESVLNPVQGTRLSLRLSQSLTAGGEGLKPTGKDMSGVVDKSVEALMSFNRHLVPLPELESELSSNFKRGLSADERARRLEATGPNRLTPRKPPSKLKIFVKSMTGFFSILLWVGFLLSVFSYAVPIWLGHEGDMHNIYIAIVLLVVVILTGVIDFVQSLKSMKIMEGFKDLVPRYATVYIDGHKTEVVVEELVLGDIVELRVGAKTPADCRVLQSDQLAIDLSSLTGESDPIPRFANRNDPNYLHSENMCYFTTNVMAGSGTGVVVARGDDTAIGHIAKLTQEAESGKGSVMPLQREVNRFVVIISIIAVIIGVVFLIFGLIDKNSTYMEDIIFAIGIIVANVPEGLLTTITVSLSLGARSLSKSNVLVKSISSVDTLGCCDVVCSDKTGTITRNDMVVQHIWGAFAPNDTPSEEVVPHIREVTTNWGESAMIIEGRMTESGDTVDPATSYTSWGHALNRLLRCSALCSRSVFDSSEVLLDEAGSPMPINPLTQHIIGDATEAGLLRFNTTVQGYRYTGIDGVGTMRMEYPKVLEIPFTSERKIQLSQHNFNEDSREVVHDGYMDISSGTKDVVVLKGAPERVFSRCSHWLHGERLIPITDEMRLEFTKANNTLAACGERVLAFADKIVEPLDASIVGRDPDHESSHTDSGHLNPAPDSSHSETTTKPMTVEEAEEAAKQRLLTENDYIFLGLISLMDPPRDGVLEAVRSCKSASIQVIMITGDQSETAKAISRRVEILTGKTLCEVARDHGIDPSGRTAVQLELLLGIPEKENAYVTRPDPSLPFLDGEETIPFDSPDAVHERPVGIVVTGPELETYNPAELNYVLDVYPNLIFTRTTPHQKLQIVQALQEQFKIVACTGDGINDAPALSGADIGIAMMNGSDVSKDAADMILLDGSFASIILGIAQGRKAYDNLKKCICFSLTSNMPQIIPFLLYITAGIPLMITTIIVLAIDLGADLFIGISFAYEPAEANLMLRKPRGNPDRKTGRAGAKYESLVDWHLLFTMFIVVGIPQAIAGILNFLFVMWKEGVDFSLLVQNRPATGIDPEVLKIGRSAFFWGVLIVQIPDALICKTRYQSVFKHGIFKNRIMLLSLLIAILVGLLMVYLPGLNKILGMAPMKGLYFLPAIPVGLLLFVYDELRKLGLRRRGEGSCVWHALRW